jgi:hypothetical protein
VSGKCKFCLVGFAHCSWLRNLCREKELCILVFQILSPKRAFLATLRARYKGAIPDSLPDEMASLFKTQFFHVLPDPTIY